MTDGPSKSLQVLLHLCVGNHVPAAASEEMPERIDLICSKRGISYAITQEWAAQLYAPFLSSISQVRCWLPPDRSTEALLNDLPAREVNEGANLAVMEAKSHGQFLFRERIRNVWLASPVLVYLDLLSGEGRAKEMAQNLRRERIRF